jgi:hypothetical protein
MDWCASRKTVSVIKAFCETGFLEAALRAFTVIRDVFLGAAFFTAALLGAAFFARVLAGAFLAGVFFVFLVVKRYPPSV